MENLYVRLCVLNSINIFLVIIINQQIKLSYEN